MALWPKAQFQRVSTCSGTLRPIAVCLHHQAGSGNPAPVYESRRVSAHFWIPRLGPPIQHVDTGVQAWHGVAHNGYSIGVETEGCGAPPHAEPLTENQLDLFAELMAWANRVHGIPLRLSERVDEPGLNYHRCQGGPATGCPCDVRKNARSEILRRAGAVDLGPAPAPPSEEEDNMVLRDKISGGVWVAKRDGSVITIGPAPYLGGSNTDNVARTKRCVGIVEGPGDGYSTVHEFGPDDYRQFQYPRK